MAHLTVVMTSLTSDGSHVCPHKILQCCLNREIPTLLVLPGKGGHYYDGVGHSITATKLRWLVRCLAVDHARHAHWHSQGPASAVAYI
jgi:hypothetical protein